ncbi:MAG: hypothetical protein ABW022_11135 [Actinoplanes sp.]
MDELDRAIFLGRLGLSTEAIGPPEEWAPTDRTTHQQRHAQFWQVVSDILPDDEKDEPEWMTEAATAALEANN